MLSQIPGPIALLPTMRIQPIAAAEVASALATLAVEEPIGMAPELAGQQESLPDLGRRLVRARGKHRLVLPIRLPGHVARAWAHGALLPTEPGPRGTQAFAQWLAATR